MLISIREFQHKLVMDCFAGLVKTGSDNGLVKDALLCKRPESLLLKIKPAGAVGPDAHCVNKLMRQGPASQAKKGRDAFVKLI
jgi:hypothetical protein